MDVTCWTGPLWEFKLQWSGDHTAAYTDCLGTDLVAQDVWTVAREVDKDATTGGDFLWCWKDMPKVSKSQKLCFFRCFCWFKVWLNQLWKKKTYIESLGVSLDLGFCFLHRLGVLFEVVVEIGWGAATDPRATTLWPRAPELSFGPFFRWIHVSNGSYQQKNNQKQFCWTYLK